MTATLALLCGLAFGGDYTYTGTGSAATIQWSGSVPGAISLDLIHLGDTGWGPAPRAPSEQVLRDVLAVTGVADASFTATATPRTVTISSSRRTFGISSAVALLVTCYIDTRVVHQVAVRAGRITLVTMPVGTTRMTARTVRGSATANLWWSLR